MRSDRLKLIPATLTISLVVAYFATLGHSARRTADDAVRRFLGNRITFVIERADTIRSFLLDPHSYAGSAPPDSLLGGSWKIVRAGPALNTDQARRLRKAVLSSKTYLFNVTKECFPHPGLGLRFTNEGRRVDLALCFECLMWSFHSDVENRGEDFDGSARQLRELAHELFPEVDKFTRLGPGGDPVRLADASLPREVVGMETAAHPTSSH